LEEFRWNIFWWVWDLISKVLLILV
jgi:hypothetical protein